MLIQSILAEMPWLIIATIVPSTAKLLGIMWSLRGTTPTERPSIIRAMAAVYTPKTRQRPGQRPP